MKPRPYHSNVTPEKISLIVGAAVMFENTVDLVVEELMRSGPTILTVMAPMAANTAFSVELYLKALLLINGKEIPKKHDLDVLYDRLNPDTQTRLQARFNALQLRSGSLRDYLGRCSKAFDHWRYMHEWFGSDEDARSSPPSRQLPSIFREVVLELRPDLAGGPAEEPAGP